MASKIDAIMSFSSPLIQWHPPKGQQPPRPRVAGFSSPCHKVQWISPCWGGISATSGHS